MSKEYKQTQIGPNDKTIERIVYFKKQLWKDPKTEYRIFQLQSEDKTKEIVAKGRVFDPVVGGRYKISANWCYNTKRSEWQLDVIKMEPDFDRSEEGVVNYLKNELKGIGEVKARDLYRVYKEQTLSVLRDQPREISENFKLSLGACQAISEYLKSETNSSGTKRQLYEIGLTTWEVNTIMGKFGKESGTKIRENCFQLTEIKGLGWQKVSKIADAIGVAKDDSNRIKAAIKYAIQDLTNGGHVCIYGHEIIDLAQKMIGIQHLNVSREIEQLIEEGKLYSEETDPHKVIEDQQVFQEAELHKAVEKALS